MKDAESSFLLNHRNYQLKSTTGDFQDFLLLYSVLLGEVWFCGQKYGCIKPFPNPHQAPKTRWKNSETRCRTPLLHHLMPGRLLGWCWVVTEGGIPAGHYDLTPKASLAGVSGTMRRHQALRGLYLHLPHQKHPEVFETQVLHFIRAHTRRR